MGLGSSKVDHKRIQRLVDDVVNHAFSELDGKPEIFGWLYHPMLEMTAPERDQMIEKIREIGTTVDQAEVAVILVQQPESCGKSGVVVQPDSPKNIGSHVERYPGQPVFYFKRN
ncbi:hypothetical protein HQ571_06385 [Candidatus Kuenenbacteria bacterium]|nr:hypothetical protein [Candidatus Kuenenbacteria bacterium]